MDGKSLVASALWCMALFGAVGTAVLLYAILVDGLEIGAAIIRGDALIGAALIGGIVGSVSLIRPKP